LKLTLAQLPLAVQALLEGGTLDEVTNTYTFKTTDSPPELALGFAALMLGGGSRMWVYYACKLLSLKADHATRGDKNEVQSYELTLRATQRKTDGSIGAVRDAEERDFGWFDGN
jgi:hypothetical protein